MELSLSSGYDAVMTVVDSVLKWAHFIPIHTMVTAKEAARLFLHQVWKLHGLPKCVILDHGPQFVACFTKELYCLLGIKLASSIAWHPQTNGQTEHINQELDQYLQLCEQMARWLVQPLTHGRVPAQQLCLLYYPTASVFARHWMASSHGLWTPTEPFRSRDSQWVHRKDENGNRRSKVHNLQSTEQHEEILWPSKNSSSGVQTWWQSLPWCIGYPDYMPFTETLTLTAWPLCSGTVDQTYGLLLKATTLDEATPSSV